MLWPVRLRIGLTGCGACVIGSVRCSSFSVFFEKEQGYNHTLNGPAAVHAGHFNFVRGHDFLDRRANVGHPHVDAGRL